MGNNWRFLTETVKQKWGITSERGFRPTSNARNEAMFIEATKFANHLKQFEKDLKGWQKNIEASFSTLQGALSAPLPKTQESDPERLDVSTDTLGMAAAELNSKLETEVLKPIQQWMIAYKMIQEHMKKSEELRLILDSRRRTVLALKGKEERYKSLVTGTNREKGELTLRQTQHQMIHKEEKMNRDLDRFREKEQAVYNCLFTLINDTCVLRDYAAAAVQIMQKCFEKGNEAFVEGAASQYHAEHAYESQVLAADPNHLNINTSAKVSYVHGKQEQYDPGYMPNPHSDGMHYAEQKPASPYAPRSPYGHQNYAQSGAFADAQHDGYGMSHR